MRLRKLIVGVLGLALVAGTLVLAPATTDSAHAQTADAFAAETAVAAFEKYAQANSTYTIPGVGQNNSSQGFFWYANGTSYPASIGIELLSLGHLPPGWPNDRYYLARELLTYRCKDRVAVFAYRTGSYPSYADSSWWTNNGCSTYPLSFDGYPYFKLSRPLSDFPSLDDRRVTAVAQAVRALESYDAAHGTFLVAGGGKNGEGWYQHKDGGNYPDSITSRLVQGGHLTWNYLTDPLDTDKSTHSGKDFLVYRCKNRVAVFSVADSVKPSNADANWWAANGCTNYPIVTKGHTYFKLSRPDTGDRFRIPAVAQAVDALESYGDTHLTYVVAGGGNGGQGWYQLRNGTNYPESIAGQLIREGHLPSDYLTDPGDADKATHSNADLMVYRCKNRIAVFSLSSGAKPTTWASDWWASNGCPTSPINTYNHPYFELSKPVSTTASNDGLRILGVSQAVRALESYGAENFTYSPLGSGYNNQGRGWWESTAPSSYTTSIAALLETTGHLDGAVLGDPTGDFLVYQCQDRVAVFADSDHIQTLASDAAWWAANGCTNYPIVTKGHTYFQLSSALPTATCRGEVVTVNMNLGQQPTGNRDIIFGTPGNDDIYAWHDETVCTGRGNDTVRVHSWRTVVDLGPGDDKVVGKPTGDVTIYGGTGNDTIEIDPYSNWIEVHAGPGNDRIIGGAGWDTLYGDDGADYIDGRIGNDTIDGGPGGDDLRGGDDQDTIDGGSGNDKIYGQAGNDTLRGGDGNDRIWGSTGYDTLHGDAGDDELNGNDSADVLHGGTGDDLLRGQEGRDTLNGNAGNDTLDGGADVDTLNGGAGIDLCFEPGSNCETQNDTEPPTDFDFSVAAAATQYLVVKWDASTDNLGVTEYKIFLNGAVRATIRTGTTDFANRSYTIGGLTGQTVYEVEMQALDEQGNTSTLRSVQNRTASDKLYSTTSPMPAGEFPCGSEHGSPCPAWTSAASLTVTSLSTYWVKVAWDGLEDATSTIHFEIVASSGGHSTTNYHDVNDFPWEIEINDFGNGAPTQLDTFEFVVTAVDADGVRSTPLTVDGTIPALPTPTPVPTPEPTPTPQPTPGPTPTPTSGPIIDAPAPEPGEVPEWLPFEPGFVIPVLPPDLPTPEDIFGPPTTDVPTWTCQAGDFKRFLTPDRAYVSWTNEPPLVDHYRISVTPVPPDGQAVDPTDLRYYQTPNAAVVIGSLSESTPYLAVFQARSLTGRSLGFCTTSFTTPTGIAPADRLDFPIDRTGNSLVFGRSEGKVYTVEGEVGGAVFYLHCMPLNDDTRSLAPDQAVVDQLLLAVRWVDLSPAICRMVTGDESVDGGEDFLIDHGDIETSHRSVDYQTYGLTYETATATYEGCLGPDFNTLVVQCDYKVTSAGYHLRWFVGDGVTISDIGDIFVDISQNTGLQCVVDIFEQALGSPPLDGFDPCLAELESGFDPVFEIDVECTATMVTIRLLGHGNVVNRVELDGGLIGFNADGDPVERVVPVEDVDPWLYLEHCS